VGWGAQGRASGGERGAARWAGTHAAGVALGWNGGGRGERELGRARESASWAALGWRAGEVGKARWASDACGQRSWAAERRGAGWPSGPERPSGPGGGRGAVWAGQGKGGMGLFLFSPISFIFSSFFYFFPCSSFESWFSFNSNSTTLTILGRCTSKQPLIQK
jgi:hypothetical protein